LRRDARRRRAPVRRAFRRLPRFSPSSAATIPRSSCPAEVALEGLLDLAAGCAYWRSSDARSADGPFFEETLYVTPSRRRTSNAIHDASQGGAAWPPRPIHAELRV
jgi:hypothetical protein